MPRLNLVDNPLEVAQAIAQGELQTNNEPGAIYVGNVDYNVSQEELRNLFATCGPVIRVTIPMNPKTQSPKGFAYITFDATAAPDAVATALGLDGLLEANGRFLKILAKRVNVPGLKTRTPYTDGVEEKETGSSSQS